MPYLPNVDYNRLYCFDSASGSSSSMMEVTASPAACTVDSNCPSPTPFCLGGMCRECRYSTDCAPPTSFGWTKNFCSFDTNYSCSECVSDSDCTGKICRTVSDGVLPARKRCVSCEATIVPEDGVVRSPATCDWFCEDPNDMVGPDGKCTPCPKCQDGEMLIPTEDFTLSTPNYFFQSCNRARNPRCVKCPGISNPCADLLSPTTSYTGVVGVGQLGSVYACRTFKCKPGWWLDTKINQCRVCDYRSCPAGQKLYNCGVASAGYCVPCSVTFPEGYWFINPRDASHAVTVADDVCKPQCNSNEVLARTDMNSPWICTTCGGDEKCSPGYLFTGCGGPNPGQCMQCSPQPLPGTFWSGPGCAVSVCNPADCPVGQTLVGCGGTSAGRCEICPTPLPANAVGYASIFYENTVTRDTCGVECAGGFFVRRTENTYECVQCDASVCGSGQQLIGCAGDQPGTCGSCPAPSMGLYSIASPGNPCGTAACPSDSSSCPAGQYYANCGGSNAGGCTSCGALPPGAASWIQSVAGSLVTCDFTCDTNYYKNISFDGKIQTCQSCDGLAATSCPTGQQLVGCSASSPGSCEACPAIPANTYWTGSVGCATGDCLKRGCGRDEIALGCGATNPGTCTKCSSIEAVPMNASGWTVVGNECLPTCSAGYYRSPSGTCEQCSLSSCVSGYVLSGCGNTSVGSCVKCSTIAAGQCFAGYGSKLDDLSSCPLSSCTS